VVLGLACATAAGFARLYRRSPWAAVVIATPVASLVASYAAFRFGAGVEFRYWYQYYAYPPAFALAAVGFCGIASTLRIPVRLRPLAGIAVLAAFGALVTPALVSMARHPFECFRESVALTRGSGKRGTDPERSETVTVAYWRAAVLYDPRLIADHPAPSVLAARVASARAAGHDLFVTAGNFGFVQGATPDVYRMLEDPDGDFEKITVLHAEDPMFTLYLYKMKPGRSEPQVEPAPVAP
jgi:hypothetical protein